MQPTEGGRVVLSGRSRACSIHSTTACPPRSSGRGPLSSPRPTCHTTRCVWGWAASESTWAALAPDHSTPTGHVALTSSQGPARRLPLQLRKITPEEGVYGADIWNRWMLGGEGKGEGAVCCVHGSR
jgi:hypothetical protein